MAKAVQPAPAVVNGGDHPQLASLHALYNVLKPQLDKLEATVKGLKETMGPELRMAAPGAETIILRTPGLAPDLQYTHSEPKRVSAPLLREAYPDAYNACLIKGDQWSLQSVKP